ncbi:type II toxin-antitoxin system VapC family toxin [Rhizobium halophilum]|uniref:type II toxin-antitoxin system VapC family toxin n=1 Tax=Rhizobium halophilum TaxID=2846852 RepID=UPI001EFE4330|nr:PIN domain-containing protein [Rhizobium halophilum]MCF6367246.1 PIN domain-containing protein [Rhizobium halophilum]
MSSPASYYWDTCVFIAHLNDERSSKGQIIDHISQHLKDAQAGRTKIYSSSITIAEITQKSLVAAGIGTFDDFLRDFGGSVIPISPDPEMMALASHLRSLLYSDGTTFRKLATPDAIHLATAIMLPETYGVTLNEFHTFDEGKRRGAGDKGLPLIGMEHWIEDCKDDPWIKKALSLARKRPEHPTPELLI